MKKIGLVIGMLICLLIPVSANGSVNCQIVKSSFIRLFFPFFQNRNKYPRGHLRLLEKARTQTETIAQERYTPVAEKTQSMIDYLNSLPQTVDMEERAELWKFFAQEANNYSKIFYGKEFHSNPFPTSDRTIAFVGGNRPTFVDEKLTEMVPVLIIGNDGKVVKGMITPERKQSRRPLSLKEITK